MADALVPRFEGRDWFKSFHGQRPNLKKRGRSLTQLHPCARAKKKSNDLTLQCIQGWPCQAVFALMSQEAQMPIDLYI